MTIKFSNRLFNYDNLAGVSFWKDDSYDTFRPVYINIRFSTGEFEAYQLNTDKTPEELLEELEGAIICDRPYIELK